MKRIEVLKGREKELKSKLKKSNSNKEMWKYAYQNKITEFFSVAKSIKEDFFKGNKEIESFLKILKIELVSAKSKGGKAK